MHLTINEDDHVQLDLEQDDEQITINIEPAEVFCFGGTIANLGTGPLVQVVVTDRAAKTVVEYHHVRVGNPYLEVQFSPLEENDSDGHPARERLL